MEKTLLELHLQTFAFHRWNGSAWNNAVEIDTDGIITPDTGTGGIKLGGAAAANLLDDYEEGTFTPLFYGGSSGTAENSSSGYYTKIGRQVTIHVDVYNKAFGTYSGDLRMQLPFTNAGTSIPSSAGDIYFYPSGNWDDVSNFAGIGVRCYNTSYLTFPLIQLDSDRQTNIGSSNTSTSNSSGNFLRFSFTYVTNL